MKDDRFLRNLFPSARIGGLVTFIFGTLLIFLPTPTFAIDEDKTSSIARHEAAKRLILDIGIDRSFDTIVENQRIEVKALICNEYPVACSKMSATDGQDMQQMAIISNMMVDAAASVYEELFTADDIKQLDLFYRSDLGKKYVSKQPEFLERLVGNLQVVRVAVRNIIYSRLRAEIIGNEASPMSKSIPAHQQ